MDTLLQLETVLERIAKRAHGKTDVEDARAACQTLATLKKEFEGLRQERQKLVAGSVESNARIKVLEQEVALLKSGQPAAAKAGDQFIEHLGAVFVRKPGGRILDTPRCRQCKKPLKAIARDMPYSCPACQIFTLFRPSEIHDVLLTLRR